jgi:dihydrofolate synthase/folylpolyglutamate synthase
MQEHTITTYRQALDYLYHFSDFERGGAFARDPENGLRRMRALLAELGDPHLAYTSTHVAGTKGKGSTAVLIAAGLSASGIRTGLYTQPDLHTFRERIQIDGEPISEAEVAALVPEIQAAIARLDPAVVGQFITFEVGTALAFLAFARRGVAHAVIEVGLGGRLDPTNVIDPLVGVITPISLDHTAILGDTITAIAGEKAGIIKPGMMLITSAQHPDALAVIAATCAAKGVQIIRVGPEGSDARYRYATAPAPPIADPVHLLPPPFVIHTPERDDTVQIALLGQHQRLNATAALAALDALYARGVPVTEAGIHAGLRAARWPARLDVVGSQPWLVVDGAHNADSMAVLLAALEECFVFDRMLLVLGMMQDKDLAGMHDAIMAHRRRLLGIIATQGHSPRAMPPARIAGTFPMETMLLNALAPDVGEALTFARQMAGPRDLICLTGSLYLAGEGLRWIAANVDDPLARAIPIAGNDH